jgi:hypothetical protein
VRTRHACYPGEQDPIAAHDIGARATERVFRACAEAEGVTIERDATAIDAILLPSKTVSSILSRTQPQNAIWPYAVNESRHASLDRGWAASLALTV